MSKKPKEVIRRSPLGKSDPEPGDMLQVPVVNVSGRKSPNTEVETKKGFGKNDNPPNSKKSNRSSRQMPKDRNQQTVVGPLDKYIDAKALLPSASSRPDNTGAWAALSRGSGGNVASVNGGPQAESRSIGSWMHCADRSGVHSDWTIVRDRRGPRTDFPSGPAGVLDEPQVSDYFSRPAGLDQRHAAIEHHSDRVRRDDVVLHPWDQGLAPLPSQYGGRLQGPHTRERQAAAATPPATVTSTIGPEFDAVNSG